MQSEKIAKDDIGIGKSVIPHNRSSTEAYVWILEKNLREDEVIYDSKFNRNNKKLLKVRRERGPAKVNGGASTFGEIVSV